MQKTPRVHPLRGRGVWRLGLAVGLLAIVWLGVLPWIAARPRMKAHVRWLDERGIDAGAMYYTELEMMGPLLRRLERPQRTAPRQ